MNSAKNNCDQSPKIEIDGFVRSFRAETKTHNHFSKLIGKISIVEIHLAKTTPIFEARIDLVFGWCVEKKQINFVYIILASRKCVEMVNMYVHKH